MFNKTDVQPHDFAVEWMKDFEAFQRALAEHGSQRSGVRASDGEPNYMDSLMNSMSLVLDEFYNHLTVSPSIVHALGKVSKLFDGSIELLSRLLGRRCVLCDRRWHKGILYRR